MGLHSSMEQYAMVQIGLQWLAAARLDVSQVRRAADGTATGLSVILQHGTWRNILTYPGTISKLCFEDLDFDYLSSARHFHLSSFYLQTALQPRAAELFHELKAAGLTISMDTNSEPDAQWQVGLLERLR